jgi:regulator of cell morphogenesis and NO signaling
MPTLEEDILNVTLLEPGKKHPAIFARFDQLAEGETFLIYNDHDPKPLYYQLLGKTGNMFNWEYIEQGPEWWKVRIGKRISGQNDETLGQIAAKDLRKAAIFKKYGLDFCCGGKKTVKEACLEKGLDITKIEQELQQAGKDSAARSISYGEWGIDFLADYIVNSHHAYVKKTLPDLRYYAAKVARAHGGQHPELSTIQELVEVMNTELLSHMIKEEKVLFPYIKQLVWAINNPQTPLPAAQFGSVQQPIDKMEMEHESVGEVLQEIRRVSNDFSLPEDACGSYNLLYRMLLEFESDLHIHIHLENNILFPKASSIEKKLFP